MAEQTQEAATSEPTIKFDDKEYPVSSLSEEAKAELQSYRFAQQEAERLRAQLAITQTAANAYRRGLIDKLPKED